MTLTLDAHSVELIQREMECHHFADPQEVVAHALELLAVEDECWSEEEKAELDRRYDEAIAQQARAQAVPSHRVREVLAQMRAARR